MVTKQHAKISGLAAVAVAAALLAVPSGALASPAYDAALQRMLARPADAEAAFQFATIAAQEGDVTAAISALERILLIHPGLDNIRLELGVLHLRNGNTALGQKLIEEAMKSPDIPDDVRARSQQFLTAARSAEAPAAFAGTVSFGLRHESNANAAPDQTFSIGSFTLSPGSTGRADTSYTFGAALRSRVDLGMQAGHQLALDLSYFGNRYQTETQLDLDRLGASAGADFNIGMGGPNPSRLSFRLDAAKYLRDGSHFLTETGASLRYGFRASPTMQAQVSAYYLDQEYRATAAEPANDLRDGHIAGFSAQLDMALSDRQAAFVALNAYDKSARVDYEAFHEASIAAGYSLAFDGPGAMAANGPWVAGLSASLGRRVYAGPDTVIDPVNAREDKTMAVSLSLRVPVTARTLMTGEVSYSRRESNYPTSEYDNLAATIGLELNF